jgi:hypothetical protein
MEIRSTYLKRLLSKTMFMGGIVHVKETYSTSALFYRS